MMKNIAIVTCHRDWHQFSLLIHTLDRYLMDSSHIHVIWNDTGHMPKFQLEHHAYTVYARADIVAWDLVQTGMYTGGWHTQQVLKLFIWRKLHTSYLVLDSQLCLLGPVTWAELMAEACLHDQVSRTNFTPWAHRVAAQHTWPITALLAPQSPYWFEHECLELCFSMYTDSQLIDLFVHADLPSEYHLLDMIRQNLTDIRYTGTYPRMLAFINRPAQLRQLALPCRISSIPSGFWYKARPTLLARLALDYHEHIAYNRDYTGHV